MLPSAKATCFSDLRASVMGRIPWKKLCSMAGFKTIWARPPKRRMPWAERTPWSFYGRQPPLSVQRSPLLLQAGQSLYKGTTLRSWPNSECHVCFWLPQRALSIHHWKRAQLFGSQSVLLKYITIIHNYQTDDDDLYICSSTSFRCFAIQKAAISPPSHNDESDWGWQSLVAICF